MRVRQKGVVITTYPPGQAVRRIRTHLSISGEVLSSLGLANDAVTGFAIGGFVFAYPRPSGVVPLDTLRGLKLLGRVRSDSAGGATFSWRIGSPRIRAFPEHEGAEEALLRNWVAIVEQDLTSRA